MVYTICYGKYVHSVILTPTPMAYIT
jgi:hypothetical protein